MGFNDNSGDITLDAVLTDLGRELLARADGSFKITHFALGDDEIDYSLYDATASTGTESTSLRQLPVFEASTESSIGLKHRLISMTNSDQLFMPVVKLNELQRNTQKSSGGYFAICVNKKTEDLIFNNNSTVQGVLAGANPTEQDTFILLHQGLDTDKKPASELLDPQFYETGYVIQLDTRFGSIVSVGTTAINANLSFIDDDNIGYYDASLEGFGGFAQTVDTGSGNQQGVVGNQFVQPINNDTDSKFMTIQGSRGTLLQFKVKSSSLLSIDNSTSIFTELGGTMSSTTFGASGTNDLYFIDSTIRVRAKVTGYQLDIPVRFIKEI